MLIGFVSVVTVFIPQFANNLGTRCLTANLNWHFVKLVRGLSFFLLSHHSVSTADSHLPCFSKAIIKTSSRLMATKPRMADLVRNDVIEEIERSLCFDRIYCRFLSFAFASRHAVFLAKLQRLNVMLKGRLEHTIHCFDCPHYSWLLCCFNDDLSLACNGIVHLLRLIERRLVTTESKKRFNVLCQPLNR